MQQAAWTRVSVKRTHLEMRDRKALRPSSAPAEMAELAPRRGLSAADYLALYSLIGEKWLWRDRLAWNDEELGAYLSSPDVHLWTLVVGDATAGYFELKQHGDRSVEVMYFGLAPAFIGRGLGGWLLTRAVEEAFTLGATRVILNTCTLDSPHALPNYLARGFTIVSEDQYLLDVPSRVKEFALPEYPRSVATRS